MIGIDCPTHRWQAGCTRCRFCGHDPIKVNRRTNLLPSGDAVLAQPSPDGLGLLYLQQQVNAPSADVFHADSIIFLPENCHA